MSGQGAGEGRSSSSRSPERELVEAVAADLRQVRQRGISRIDGNMPTVKKRLAVPMLRRLATVPFPVPEGAPETDSETDDGERGRALPDQQDFSRGDATGDLADLQPRADEPGEPQELGPLGELGEADAEGVRAYLAAAFDAFEVKALLSATLLRPLFFDAEGNAPGPAGPSGLLGLAQQDASVTKSHFRKQRAEHLLMFAEFILSAHAPASGEETAERAKAAGSERAARGEATALLEQFETLLDARERWRRRRALIVTAACVALLVVSLLGWRVWGRADEPAAAGMFTFDSLGGQPIIDVYPGPRDSARDKVKNGTYRHGNKMAALCKVTGRRITSDPSAGERPRTSNVWVRIPDQDGKQRYASLTYGHLRPEGSTMPTCHRVP